MRKKETSSYGWNLDDEAETEILISYTISEGSAETYDDPAEPSEVEITDVVDVHGKIIELSDEMEKKMRQRILEEHEWNDGPDPDDARDALQDRLAELDLVDFHRKLTR